MTRLITKTQISTGSGANKATIPKGTEGNVIAITRSGKDDHWVYLCSFPGHTEVACLLSEIDIKSASL